MLSVFGLVNDYNIILSDPLLHQLRDISAVSSEIIEISPRHQLSVLVGEINISFLVVVSKEDEELLEILQHTLNDLEV